MSANIKTLGENEFHVEVQYKGRKYTDNASLPGLKNLLKELDEKSDQYKIIKKMVGAINKHLNKAVGGSDEVIEQDGET